MQRFRSIVAARPERPCPVPGTGRVTRGHRFATDFRADRLGCGLVPYRRGMGRARRLELENGTFHLTSRGNRRQPIFTADVDYRLFLDIASSVVRELGWRCPAYCLMPNHYHLVATTPSPNLSRGMHRINGRYAHVFNERHGLEGHVFQGRFYSRRVETDAHLLEVARYVVLNPVGAGLCAHPSEWPWSSYGATAGLTAAERLLSVEWLMSNFGGNAAHARVRWLAFVADGATAPRPAA